MGEAIGEVLPLAIGIAISPIPIDTIGAVIVFVLIASVSIAGPVLVYLFGGEGVRHWLDELKEWLNENNATVMTVLFVVLGVVVLGQGIRALAQ